MSIDKVREYLKKFGAESGIMEFDVSSATVELAAEAVGVEPARIAKSLSFKVEEGCIIVVTAGDMHIDNKKYKAEFGIKAKMLNFEEVEEFTGFRVGGVCPFALPENVDVYLDESLKQNPIAYPPESIIKKCESHKYLPKDINAKMEALWTEIRN